MSLQHFNSIEAAKILGVNVSSIKRWTDEGKLRCIKTAGGHRKFLMNHIAAFLEENKKQTSKAHIFPIEDTADVRISYHILKGNFDFLTDYLIEQALNARRDKLHQVINGLYLSQFPLHIIYDNLITPVLHRIGKMWEEDKISVTEEHFSTQTIKDGIIRLQSIINIPNKKIGTAICINLSNELHDIALKMVDHILEEHGFQIYFSGQMTPFMKTRQLFDRIKPDRLFISSTIVLDRKTIQDELDSVLDLALEYKTKVYVGGRGFDILRFNHPAVVRRLTKMEDVYLSITEKDKKAA